MIYNEVCTLIKRQYTTNGVGDSIPTETSRDVFCCVKSIGMKRKLEAEQFGLKLEYKFILADRAEYAEEEQIAFKGKRYNIVDVYETESGTVELTVKRF